MDRPPHTLDEIIPHVVVDGIRLRLDLVLGGPFQELLAKRERRRARLPPDQRGESSADVVLVGRDDFDRLAAALTHGAQATLTIRRLITWIGLIAQKAGEQGIAVTEADVEHAGLHGTLLEYADLGQRTRVFRFVPESEP